MKISKLAMRLRNNYKNGAANPADITEFLDECLAPINRKEVAACIQDGKTVYGCDPVFPQKLIRVNPDGSREIGHWTEHGFQPD